MQCGPCLRSERRGQLLCMMRYVMISDPAGHRVQHYVACRSWLGTAKRNSVVDFDDLRAATTVGACDPAPVTAWGSVEVCAPPLRTSLKSTRMDPFRRLTMVRDAGRDFGSPPQCTPLRLRGRLFHLWRVADLAAQVLRATFGLGADRSDCGCAGLFPRLPFVSDLPVTLVFSLVCVMPTRVAGPSRCPSLLAELCGLRLINEHMFRGSSVDSSGRVQVSSRSCCPRCCSNG